MLLAYQLCFDLFENESQAFNFKVKTSTTLPVWIMTLILEPHDISMGRWVSSILTSNRPK